MSSEQGGSADERQNKTNKILIGIIICLIAVIIGGAIYFTRGTDKDKENKTPDSAFEPNLDSNASETASNDGNNEEADKPEGIRIPGYPSITVPADTTDIEMNLENPAGNPCYFTFELVLKIQMKLCIPRNGRTGESNYERNTVAWT